MRVLFAASECWPLIKTGGLADVAYALPLALTRAGVDVRVVLPAYRGLPGKLENIREIGSLHLRGQHFRVIEGQLPNTSLTIWLVDAPYLYDRAGDPYRDEFGRDFADNAWRFGCFCEAVHGLALGAAGWRADVVHANDWQTGPALSWLSTESPRPRLIFTIHNIAYQGWFGREAFDFLGLPRQLWSIDGVEMHGGFNFMKAGLSAADVITTVSPNYAREIQTPEYGNGLDGLLRWRSGQLVGIVNGVETEAWSPATDKLIARRFSPASLKQGKNANKKALQHELRLAEDSEATVVGIVTRLAEQKGSDLVLGALDALLIRHPQLQFAVLASGDKEQEQGWRDATARYPGRVGTHLRYDERLAHLVEAGADIFLMPSRFEPCGLNQMYSQRYGTIPVVRRTGGLADTVTDASIENIANGSATGVHFENADIGGVLWGVERAIELKQNNPRVWKQMQLAGMERDFSWERAAAEYLKLYRA
ncbi:glycogen synthase GlgA [Hydrocarboniphaga effusa]|jgi:starch synthase|uniref:glycogen synthase GlgA n=1 Tax=Hydrocarboniphaga effusa TaxID=243629 RepID=UPI003137CB30